MSLFWEATSVLCVIAQPMESQSNGIDHIEVNQTK